MKALIPFLISFFLFVPQGFSEELKKIPEADEMTAWLKRRNFMLKAHKHLAYTTFALMTASLLTPHANVNVHKALGGATLATYGAAAYFSIFATVPEGLVPRKEKIWQIWVYKSDF